MTELRRTATVLALACGHALLAPLPAQRLQGEVRADVVGPRTPIVSPAVGLTIPLGYYVRVTALGGIAASPDSTFLSDRWRGELLARFLFDPFRQQRWGVSVGGGLSVRRQTYLAAVLDLEGPPVLGFLPALQAGVSGGARAGLVLRRAIAGRR